MAAELGAGYVSLTVRMAKGGMADVTKEVKKAGAEGGKEYSDEFAKQATKSTKGIVKAAKEAAEQFGNGFREGIDKELATGGGTDGIPEIIAKATKKGGATKKAAKEAAKEFTEGFKDGVKQAIGEHGGISSSLDVLSDKVRDTTKTLASLGDATGIDTGPVERVSKTISTAIDGISSSVSNTKDSLAAFKERDVVGGLQGAVDALRGLESVGLSKDFGDRIQHVADATANTKTQIDGILGPLEHLTELAGEDSKLYKVGKKLPLVGDVLELATAAREANTEFEKWVETLTGKKIPTSLLTQMQALFSDEGLPGSARNNVRKVLAAMQEEAALGKPIEFGTKLGAPLPSAETFRAELNAKFVGLGIEIPAKINDAAVKSWFADNRIGPAIEVPVRVTQGGIPITPLPPAPGGSLFGPSAIQPGPQPFPGRRAGGGGINGPGGPKSDNIPIMASPGEHVLTAAEVNKMGGQSGVYAFRNMLHMQGGGDLPTFWGQKWSDMTDEEKAKLRWARRRGPGRDLGPSATYMANWEKYPLLGKALNMPLGFAGGGAVGVTPEIQRIQEIASSFGLTLISGRRSQALTASGRSYHLSGEAGDFSNTGNAGNSPQMLAFAQYMASTFGTGIAELIYSAPGFNQLIGDGRNVTGGSYYSASTLRDHVGHVHIAVKPGALPSLGSQPLPTAGGAGTPSVPGGGGGGTPSAPTLSDNPMRALQQLGEQQNALDTAKAEQVKKLLPDFGQLADIGMAGLKETLLPPGFSDPTQWKSTKSIGALLGWIGGLTGDPAAASILGGIGAGLTGSGSGLYSGIMGAIPQPFGNLAPQAGQFAGATTTGSVGPMPGAPGFAGQNTGGGVQIGTYNDHSGNSAYAGAKTEAAIHNSPQTTNLTRIARP